MLRRVPLVKHIPNVILMFLFDFYCSLKGFFFCYYMYFGTSLGASTHYTNETIMKQLIWSHALLPKLGQLTNCTMKDAGTGCHVSRERSWKPLFNKFEFRMSATHKQWLTCKILYLLCLNFLYETVLLNPSIQKYLFSWHISSWTVMHKHNVHHL